MKTIHKLALAAGFVTALALNFSCSSGDDGGKGNENTAKISCIGTLLSDDFREQYTLSLIMQTCDAAKDEVLAQLANKGDCSNNAIDIKKQLGTIAVECNFVINSVNTTLRKEKISGVSQKGPFVRGSSIILNEMNNSLHQTGRSFQSQITSNDGIFKLDNIELKSNKVSLRADGYYLNEVTGEKSSAPITLYAIADLMEKNSINVNLLTHLEYFRVLNLIEEQKDISFADAKKEAQKEILEAFYINSENFKSSEDMSIFGNTDGDAALLAISILLQGNLKEGDFSDLLAEFSYAIKESDGKWADPQRLADIADFASVANLDEIDRNVTRWGLGDVPHDFKKHIRNFWYEVYGLGDCILENDVAENKNDKSKYYGNLYACKEDKIWHQIRNSDHCRKNPSLCDYFIDDRDGKRYNTVKIGDQIWMAENLNYYAENSKCYDNLTGNCDTYGRLYNWTMAMGGSASSTANPSGVRGVCPEGWHLPSQAEWNALTATIQSEQSCSSCDALHLKAASGWNSNGNGLDTYGFAALPGGHSSSGDSFSYVGSSGSWWSSSEYNENKYSAYVRGMYYGNEIAEWGIYDKSNLFSVRCLKD